MFGHRQPLRAQRRRLVGPAKTQRPPKTMTQPSSNMRGNPSQRHRRLQWTPCPPMSRPSCSNSEQGPVRELRHNQPGDIKPRRHRNLNQHRSHMSRTLLGTPWPRTSMASSQSSGLLRILQKILHEMLQQTFSTPNEYLTHLAYHSCYYLSKLQSTSDRAAQCSEPGENPTGETKAGPLAMVFCITNAFVEAEAALDSLVQHQHELPRRHLLKELRRAEALLKDERAVFKSWARNPDAPGALPGTAASQNALDGVDFSFLASEEGGVANLDESLRIALAATQRCNQYMNQLLDWIQSHCHDELSGGSPSPKRRRVEAPSGSDCQPRFVPEASELGLSTQQAGHGELQREVPDRVRDSRRHDSALPQGQDSRGMEPGAAPYNILRAQQLLERVIPFTDQEVATALQEAHSFLFQWTTGLWGEPIILSDSLETNVGTAPELAEAVGGLPHENADLPPTLPAADSSDETVSIASHRRRRLHGHFHE